MSECALLDYVAILFFGRRGFRYFLRVCCLKLSAVLGGRGFGKEKGVGGF